MCEDTLDGDGGSVRGYEDASSPSTGVSEGGCATKYALTAIAQGERDMLQDGKWRVCV